MILTMDCLLPATSIIDHQWFSTSDVYFKDTSTGGKFRKGWGGAGKLGQIYMFLHTIHSLHYYIPQEIKSYKIHSGITNSMSVWLLP